MLPRLSNVKITSLLIMNVFVVQMSLPIIVKNIRCPFFKAFLVTADVPEVYMQEFWATAYVHQRFIRFKMNNKKHTMDLESLREMLHICPRIPGQAFAELPFEEEILEFIQFLGHGTGSKPGVPDVPSDDSEEELSWNSSDDEDTDAQEKDGDDDEGDEREESFDPIPRTPKDSEDDGNGDDDQGLRISEEERLNEEEKAEELYRDVNIN
nr:hypothetical protein [Tanacetum cinerariifolium]